MSEEDIKFYGPDEALYSDGVILGQRETDYVSGAVSSLSYEVRNQSGDWSGFLPDGERQSSRRGDSQSCVTFSALNSIETQQKFLIQKANNHSDRWTAKRSGTMPNGNYLWKVADTIRKEGLAPEEMYPSPLSYTWEEYHADISEPLASQLVQAGQEWLLNWQIQYEWIAVNSESFEYHLKQAPIQIVIPGHAIMMYKFDPVTKLVYYLDSYSPFLKSKSIAEVQSALKIVLTKKEPTMTNSLLVKKDGEYGFYDPATSEDGLITMMRHRGIQPPLDSDGKLNWVEVEKLIKGQVQ